MSVKTAYSMHTSPEKIIEDIKTQFGDFQSKLLIVFASPEIDQNSLCQSMRQDFPDTGIIGCSTAGEIISGKMLKNAVVAMGLSSSLIEDFNIQVVEHIGQGQSVENAFQHFEDYYQGKMRDLDVSKYVGVVLIDGLSGAEEKLMDKIGDLTNVLFVGGSAGDNLKFKATYVYADGKAYTDAAVLALLKPTNAFKILKTQSFECLDKTLKVTKANEAKREVIEFNNQPAVEAYAKAVSDAPEKIEDHFMKHPIGLMAGGEPYVRSPQQAQGKSIIFYCNVLEGMELSLLESTDIVQGTKTAIEDANKELGGISAIVNFHCILRTLELEKKNQTDAYGKVFSAIPTIGFSTYGEEYIGHINQTSTMLLLK